jgi:2-oxoglutarate ferredoxin oxidoreductase subunit beta
MIRENLAKKYLRNERIFPHVWCAGCGIGQVLSAMLASIDRTGWSKDEIVVVSGIGCSSRLPVYIDFNTLHTTHGRALPFATGVKLANPKLHVIVVTGDGDAAAIGGNHLIHACRRNIGITTILMNNYTYGMTGGQVSPLTLAGGITSTSPYGNIEPPFDISNLAAASGATFVARTTVAHPDLLEGFIDRALGNSGFSLVEVMLPCHTSYGRRNKFKTVIDMMLDIKRRAVQSKNPCNFKAKGNNFPIGVFADRTELEFSERLRRLSERLKSKEQK